MLKEWQVLKWFDRMVAVENATQLNVRLGILKGEVSLYH